jgi:hypothetical protein
MPTKEDGHVLNLDPELVYEIVIAALDVIGSVSLGVHQRIQRDHERGRASASPTVRANSLRRLRDVLNKIDVGNGPAAENRKTKSDARSGGVTIGTLTINGYSGSDIRFPTIRRRFR